MIDKIEGIKDDIDVLALVKAFESFKDGLQLVCDRADKLEVELPFDSSLDSKTHYSFAQDEVITLSGCKVNPHNKKLIFTAVYGANDKVFSIEDAELIEVYTPADLIDDTPGGKRSLKSHIDEQFVNSFKGTEVAKIHSIAVLQAMVRNNPGLVEILNDPVKFLDEMETATSRAKAYVALEGFGRY